MASRRGATWLLCTVCIGCGGETGEAPAAGSEETVVATGAPGLAEHHAHLSSEDGQRILVEIQEAVGQSVLEERSDAIAAAELIAAMDEAGVERAQVLSVGYFFGFPDVEIEDRERRLKAENDFVAEQVMLYPERLVGACSVNPLSDYATAEVARCAADDRLSGLKLHFANSDVDLRSEDHVARIQAVFAAAAEGNLPIVVHMRTRDPDYGADDVDVFIDEILPHAPDLEIQIAHMAGWGGYDPATHEALGAWVSAFESGRLDPAHYTFDLAAVIIPPSRAEGDSARVAGLEAALHRLAERIRQLGTERVLFATDWSAIPLAGYVQTVRELLPLEDEELADIMDNQGPLFH